eukprot:TRINITY_DN5163_c0_g1_i1.p1 TRINITY_DN5163_c0_g1~~TRINITY_DN5163_c0_g1_i1.p1  ORF type:complete len:306 (+),score=29.74 TRINITY_DN5163_c0_g1_i1:77-919(+)
MVKLKLGVLGSTRGTDLQGIIDSIEQGKLDAEVSVVISNKKDAFILERARNHYLETFVIDYTKHGFQVCSASCGRGSYHLAKMVKLKLGVLGSTRGTDLQGIIDSIEQGKLDAEVSVVISNKKDAFILERARNHYLETFVIDYTKHASRESAEEEIIKKLDEKQVDLVLLIGWMRILTPVIISRFRGRFWNVHPSLLPKYAGGMNLDVHKAVLDNHETETGCTVHEVIEEVDAGKIIMQKSCAVVAGDTPETLKDKVQALEVECFLAAIQEVIDGKRTLG